MTAAQHRSEGPRRQRALLFVAAMLGAQVLVAAAMLLGPRPQPYGWQMYSAVPDAVRAWAVTGTDSIPIDIEAMLVHGRVEVDRVALLRTHGCERTGADSIRVELRDGGISEIVCP